jgi:hypothetical protein
VRFDEHKVIISIWSKEELPQGIKELINRPISSKADKKRM